MFARGTRHAAILARAGGELEPLTSDASRVLPARRVVVKLVVLRVGNIRALFTARISRHKPKPRRACYADDCAVGFASSSSCWSAAVGAGADVHFTLCVRPGDDVTEIVVCPHRTLKASFMKTVDPVVSTRPPAKVEYVLISPAYSCYTFTLSILPGAEISSVVRRPRQAVNTSVACYVLIRLADNNCACVAVEWSCCGGRHTAAVAGVALATAALYCSCVCWARRTARDLKELPGQTAARRHPAHASVSSCTRRAHVKAQERPSRSDQHVTLRAGAWGQHASNGRAEEVLLAHVRQGAGLATTDVAD